MVKIKEKIEASIMIASYLETLGFNNGQWEFNYQNSYIKNLDDFIKINSVLQNHFLVLGGISHINIKDWNSSDDTIMIIATAKAVNSDDNYNSNNNYNTDNNYKKKYLDCYDLLHEEKRVSGINTLNTLKLLKKGYDINTLPSDDTMGGNGASMRTGPIGIKYHKNYEKVIEESIKASRLTHNYYLGYLGGMVTSLFTSFAINDIPIHLWVDKLLELHNQGIIEKYYPKEHKIEDLEDFINYWRRYKETRINKLKYKNTLNTFIYPIERFEYLLGYFPDSRIKRMIAQGESLRNFDFRWDRIGSTGLDSCIYAYDCLLASIYSKNSKIIDLNNYDFSWECFATLVAIHPGDNDTTAAIGGTWYGAIVGFRDIDRERMKELEFYKELEQVSNKLYESF